MKHIKAGYAQHNELKNIRREAAQALDVINIAFAHCRSSRIYFEHPEDLAYLTKLRSFNPGLKILISVGGWGSGGFSPMAENHDTRLLFAHSCLDFVKQYGLDGVDIDWEYPALDWAGIEALPDDKMNYTKMLAEIRGCFDSSGIPGLMLTVAVGNDNYFIQNTEMDRVAPLLDYVSVMTYDMRGCGDEITGHHTNLFADKSSGDRRAYRSAEHSVSIYNAAGVPLDKLVIGAAFYSRMWNNVTPSSADRTGLGCAASPGNYGPSYSELSESYINKNGFVRYFDDICKAPYLFDGQTFISYDDPESLEHKCKYIKERGILGIMYWEHSCDKTGKLLKTINAALI